MAKVTLSIEEYQALLSAFNIANPLVPMVDLNQQPPTPTPIPKKRKVSKYNREFGRQLRALKKKHPRSKASALMKRAHALTRKALK